jgi:hypothetical protein
MFEAWETFYLLIGTSAAALVGIMFVVTTLTADVAVEDINRGTVIYQTPTVFHLGVVVAVSAFASMPEHLLLAIAALLLAAAVTGLAYSAVTIRRMYERYEFYTATALDKLLFGFLPAVSYLLLGAGAIAIWSSPEIAAEAIGAATLLLLLTAIRNSWDMATFTVRISRVIAARKTQQPE